MDFQEALNRDGNWIRTSADYSKAQEKWINSMAGLGDAGVILTSTPLGGSAAYTQIGIDRLAPNGLDKPAFPVGQVRGIVHADQVGTLYLEESENNSTWNTLASVSVSAGVTTPLPWTTLTKRYYRFRYVNGSNAQTSFVLVQQAAGLAVPNVALTGSSIPDTSRLPIKDVGKVVTLANAVAITDTNDYLYWLTTQGGLTAAEILSYSEFKVSAYNTHDQAATLAIGTMVAARGVQSQDFIYVETGNVTASGGKLVVQSRAVGTGGMSTIKTCACLEGVYSDLLVKVKFGVAPSSGSITVKVEMR